MDECVLVRCIGYLSSVCLLVASRIFLGWLVRAVSLFGLANRILFIFRVGDGYYWDGIFEVP